MNLTPNQIAILRGIAEDLEANFKTDYSGRGMFNNKCVAFVTHLSPVHFFAKVAIILCQNHQEAILAINLSDVVHVDNMGRDTAIYFPGITA